MRRSLILTAVAALGLTGPALAQQAVPIPTPVPTLPSAGGPDYAAVLASPIRTDEDRARDEARQTALIVDR